MRSGFGVHKMHNFVLPKLRLIFSERTCPIHFFRPKTKFLGGFAIPLPGGTRCEIGFWAHRMHHFVLPKLRLAFYNKHAQSTSLGPKLSFWEVSPDSVAGRYKL